MPSPTLTPDLPSAVAAIGQDTPPPSSGPPSSGPPSSGAPEPAEAATLRLRLVTVPGGWPPYDCETHGAACPVASTAAATGPRASRQVPEPAELARPATPPGSATPPGPDAAWPGKFAQVIVEILAGLRPSRQIAPWTTDRVRAQVDGLTRLLASDQRPRLQRVITSRPAVSVVEMTMVVGFGRRSRALALRFERRPARPATPGRPARPARWLCTEIEAG